MENEWYGRIVVLWYKINGAKAFWIKGFMEGDTVKEVLVIIFDKISSLVTIYDKLRGFYSMAVAINREISCY